jgi:hypothetical protein
MHWVASTGVSPSDDLDLGGPHEDDGCPQVGAEAVPYSHPMKPLSLAVKAILYLSALLVVPQDAFLYFLLSFVS